MNKVYIVWYDNGATYAEDSYTHIDKVYQSEEDAKAYADQMNNKPLSSEELDDYIGWDQKWFVTEQEVITNKTI